MTQHSIMLARADAVSNRQWLIVAICDIALGRTREDSYPDPLSHMQIFALNRMTRQEAVTFLVEQSW